MLALRAMHRLATIFFAGLPFIVGLALMAADAAMPTPDRPAILTIRKQVNEVQVSFIVEDGHKRLVRDVTRDKISILDEGVPISNLTSFRENLDLPLRLVLAIDCSDSMRRGFRHERAAAQAFVKRMLRPKLDSLLLIDFAGQSTISEMTGASPSLISTRISSFEAAGHTALYDAIFEASKRVQLRPEHQVVRRVMVLLSDGDDNDSRHARAEAVEMAQRGDMVIYAITAHSRRYEYQGDAILRRMAEATGGRAFVLSSFDQAGKALAEIENELRTQYSMTFRPAASERCGYHALQVQYHDRKMKVRARDGYYLCAASEAISSPQ